MNVPKSLGTLNLFKAQKIPCYHPFSCDLRAWGDAMQDMTVGREYNCYYKACDLKGEAIHCIQPREEVKCQNGQNSLVLPYTHLKHVTPRICVRLCLLVLVSVTVSSGLRLIIIDNKNALIAQGNDTGS